MTLHFSFLHLKAVQMFPTALYYSNKMNRTDFKVKTFFNVFVLEIGQIKLKGMGLPGSGFCL